MTSGSGSVLVSGNIDLSSIVNLESTEPKIDLKTEFNKFDANFPDGLKGFTPWSTYCDPSSLDPINGIACAGRILIEGAMNY